MFGHASRQLSFAASRCVAKASPRLLVFLRFFSRLDGKHGLSEASEARTIGGVGSEVRKVGAVHLDRIFANAKVGANVVLVVMLQIGDGIRQRTGVTASEILTLPKLLHEARCARLTLVNFVRGVMAVHLTLALVPANDVRAVDSRTFRIIARENTMKLALPGRLLRGRRVDEFRTGVIVASDADARELTVALGVDRAFRRWRGLFFGKAVARAASGHLIEKSRRKLNVDRARTRYGRRAGYMLATANRIAGGS
jgi:hypothetical protein